MKKIVIMLVAMALVAGTAQAQTEILVNGDFEGGTYIADNVPDNWLAYYDTSPTASTKVNWKSFAGGPGGAPNKWVEVTGWSSATSSWGYVYQEVPAQKNWSYSLSFSTRLIDGSAGGWAGPSLTFFDAAGASISTPISTTFTAVGSWTWYDYGTVVAPHGTASVAVTLWSYGTSDTDGDPCNGLTPAVDVIAYDNVSLTEIPEPITMGLLGLGALMLRRRK